MVRCRIVNVTEDGTIQVVPELDVIIGQGWPGRPDLLVDSIAALGGYSIGWRSACLWTARQ